MPRVMGNVKGLQDPYRNPETQKGVRGEVGSEPGDGDVVRGRLEDQLRADDRRECDGVQGAPARDVAWRRRSTDRRSTSPSLYDLDEVRALGGIVDYTVGPSAVKIFCLAEHPDPKQRHYLSLYKMGDGPLYPFWIPYHLPHFEAPNAIARVVLLGDNLAPPLGGPGRRGLRGGQARPQSRRDARRVRHVHDLRRGGQRRGDERCAATCPRASSRDADSGATSPQDEVLTYDDVDLPPGRLADRLRAEQYRHFRGETWLEERLQSASLTATVGGVPAEHRSSSLAGAHRDWRNSRRLLGSVESF